MIIGIPREIMQGENRVAAIPETVEKFIKLGFKVRVETCAGKGIHCTDQEYEKAGAVVLPDAESVYRNANIILKVKEPLFNQTVGRHELDMLKEGSLLATFLHPAAPSNHEMIKRLSDKGITSFTMDGIPRISRAQTMDALTSMSTITGYKSVLIAANHLPKFVPMISTTIGSMKPAHFLVVGIGVVGLQALATVKRLGGTVTAVDIRDEARKAAMSLGAKVGGFDVPEDLALGKWGYAKALPVDWLEKERVSLGSLIKESDAVILCALVPGEVAPVLVTEEMVFRMKPGSVIVDVSIDQGGNCSITEPGREALKHRVLICGLQNIPGSVPVHATWLYANNIFHYVKNLFKKGLGCLDLDDEIVKNSLVTYQGSIVYEGALKAIRRKTSEVDLCPPLSA
jgi:NAD(P) transhydrogenase subunit alpha